MKDQELTGCISVSDMLVSASYPKLASKLKPSNYQISCMTLLSESILQRGWDRFGPIKILSGLRDRRLNKSVGGSDTSDHLFATAADFVTLKKEFDLFYVFKWMVDMVQYRQLIYYPEKKFIHASVNSPQKDYKHEALIKDKSGIRGWKLEYTGKP